MKISTPDYSFCIITTWEVSSCIREHVLRDYKNYFKPKAGINVENIEHLQEKSSSLSGIQRYVVVVMDEMKIQSNLVYDKFSGVLIGFVDLGDPITNYAR